MELSPEVLLNWCVRGGGVHDSCGGGVFRNKSIVLLLTCHDEFTNVRGKINGMK